MVISFLFSIFYYGEPANASSGICSAFIIVVLNPLKKQGMIHEDYYCNEELFTQTYQLI